VDARMSTFLAVNEKKLTAYFSSAVDRSVAAYMANRSTIYMPATEEEVQNQHSQIAAATRGFLLNAAGGLTDTMPFEASRDRLETVITDEYKRVQDKNVELWKVHSDEATRCAANANRVAGKACGILCLFTTVPWYHKAVTRQHLTDCFTRSTMSQQMATPLRTRVFEAWYAKDLVRETSRVHTKFCVLVACCVVVITLFWWTCYRQPSAMRPGYYGQPMPPPMSTRMHPPTMHQQQFGYNNQANACYGQYPPQPGQAQGWGFGSWISRGGA